MKIGGMARRCADLVLGQGARRRGPASHSALALFVFLVCAAVQQFEVMLGLMDQVASNWLTAYNLAGATTFFALVRSGFSQRWKDPTLTMQQSAFALSSICWSYAITGPARGAILSIMIVVILFGMFGLRPGQSRALALGAFAGLATVMAWRSLTADPRYDPRVELMHFVFAAIVMTAAAILSIRLGRLRARLSDQKAELTQALELNRQLATRDMLTGLLNRRAMVELLAQEQPRQRRAGGPMALALLDIDWFKRINDTHGHQIGDAVLQRFADVARQQLRSGDALARWGGEEFLLLMPATTAADAGLVIQRLRRCIGEADFDALAPGLRVSFSAGISECRDDELYDLAIERSDQALYRAKHAGRDRFEVA
jgi:diguanylate cyclase (GGDEF)-like protein